MFNSFLSTNGCRMFIEHWPTQKKVEHTLCLKMKRKKTFYFDRTKESKKDNVHIRSHVPKKKPKKEKKKKEKNCCNECEKTR